MVMATSVARTKAPINFLVIVPTGLSSRSLQREGRQAVMSSARRMKADVRLRVDEYGLETAIDPVAGQKLDAVGDPEGICGPPGRAG